MKVALRQRSGRSSKPLLAAAVAIVIGLASFGMVVAATVRTSGQSAAAPNGAAATASVPPASEPPASERPKPTGDPNATGERLPDNRDDPTAQERTDAIAIFVADPRVISLVAGQTYEVLGVLVSKPDKAVDTGHRFMGVGVALYGVNETWGGLVDLQSLRLTSLERSPSNAGLSPAEEDRAFAIAQADPQVATLVSQLNAVRNTAYGVLDGEGPSACGNERCANVTFSVPGGNVLIVAVSLSSGRVLTIYPRR